MNKEEGDQRKEHQCDPPRPVTLDYLQKLGVLYFEIPVNEDGYYDKEKLQKIRDDRGYNYEDVVDCSPTTLPNYDDKLKSFFREHLHADEEIRYCVAGSGYFDVRAENDEWIRIEVVPGDMIIIPAGIYHRFTLDEKNYIKALRFFCGDPVWTPVNRPADDHAARVDYLRKFQSA